MIIVYVLPYSGYISTLSVLSIKFTFYANSLVITSFLYNASILAVRIVLPFLFINFYSTTVQRSLYFTHIHRIFYYSQSFCLVYWQYKYL